MHATHAGFVYKPVLGLPHSLPEFLDTPSETARRERFALSTSPVSPFVVLAALSRLLSPLSDHLSTFTLRVDYNLNSPSHAAAHGLAPDFLSLVNHATTNDGNESPAIIVRMIETGRAREIVGVTRFFFNSLFARIPPAEFFRLPRAASDSHAQRDIYKLEVVGFVLRAREIFHNSRF